MKAWQGYIEDDGGRRPGHLVLYPIEVGGLVHDNSKFKTFPGVSWWRSGLSARLLPGHNCSHWRNQELSPAWETDHIVCKQNLVQQGSSALHVVNLCLSPFLRCSTLKAMYSPYGGQKRLLQITSSVHIALQKLLAFVFSWIQYYSYIVNLHFFVS